MPTYRSITLSLISQFDLLTIPEYAPPAVSKDPFCTSPTLVSTNHSLVSVYIPTYPSSQFWLNYSISAPHPPKALYYFKLFLNGVNVMSWGCGEEDRYKGKTMFGLFDTGEVYFQERVVEKRILCFSSEYGTVPDNTVASLNDIMEVKVYRSKGRKRIKPIIPDFQTVAAAKNSTMKSPQQHGGGGISLVNAGVLTSRHPQRYYKYALLDPLDQPFATFRYYYRSWEQLEYQGVISPHYSPSSSTSPSAHSEPPPERPVSPAQDSTITNSSASTTISTATNRKDAETSSRPQPAISLTSISKAAQVLLPAPGPDEFPSSSPEKKPLDAPISGPPTPTSRPASITTQAHFATLIRALSPSKEHQPSSPSPPRLRRSGSMAVLRDVVGSAVRRRGHKGTEEVLEGEEVTNEIEQPSSKNSKMGDDGDQTSAESDDKVGKKGTIEEGSGDDEILILARKSNESDNPGKPSSDSEGSVSRERRGGTRKKAGMGVDLWERL